nr:hypothetical protein Iba_chr14aCG8720 [Ipomoea batatas]
MEQVGLVNERIEEVIRNTGPNCLWESVQRFLLLQPFRVCSIPQAQTPEAKHVQVAIAFNSIWQNAASQFRRHRGNHVENQPGFGIPPSNLLRVVYHKISVLVKIRHKERQDDVDGEKPIHNVVCDGESQAWVL